MQLFFIVLAAFLLVILVMAVGVIFGRKPIAGSCGGIPAALGEKDYVCPVCGDDPAKCDEQNPDQTATSKSQFYEANAEHPKP